MDTVDLAIRMTADASDAAAAAADVGDAYGAMATDIAAASDKADAASRDLAGGVDALGSSSSQAAGGLGDLGGALSLMPGPLGAVGTGMESLAPAIMGATGAADLMSLAMNASAVTTAKARVASIAHGVATKAQLVATKAAAAGQWALNAAMSANPLGLLIAAVLIVVGLFLLLYRRSETFRAAVDKAGDVGQRAIGWVVDKVQDLVGWVQDAVKPITGLGDEAEAVGDIGKKAFELWSTPLRTVIDLVQDLVGWIKDIDFPDIPDIPFVRTAARGSDGTAVLLAAAGGATSSPTMLVNIYGAVDPVAAGRQLMDLARQHGIITMGDPA
jgi:hypothetical protein